MSNFLLLAFIFLIAGIAAVPVATKFKLGSVLGYLLAGIAISPVLALLHVDVVSVQHFAEFGVVMMLFLVGLELNPRMMWDMRNRLLGLGGLQMGLTTAAVTGIAMLLNQPWQIALAIGLIFALSSTAIVLQTLSERKLMRSDGGQASFSILLFQDIIVIPILALMPLLALPELIDAGQVAAEAASLEGEHNGIDLNLVDGLPGWLIMLSNIGAIGMVILLGSVTTRLVFRHITLARLRELFTATALMIVIGTALLMSLVGLSPALGAFLAGVVLANSPYRHELEANIDPFRGLLLGLFFMTVGASINFGYLADNFLSVIGMTLGLIALKVAILFVLSLIFKLQGSNRWLMALGLAQAGEFGFVLLSYAVGINVLPAAIADQLLLVVALSMLLTPLLFLTYERVIVPRYIRANQREADEIDVKCKVIIAGHGRVGSVLNRMLRANGHETTVIDFNSEHLESLRHFGFRIYFGDATRHDLLHSAGIEEAKVFIIAIDDRQQITRLARYIIENYPGVKVIARATNRHHVYDLWAAGCREIVRETFDSSTRMGRLALLGLGMTEEAAETYVEKFRTGDQTMMRELAELYDPDVPVHEIPEFVKKASDLLNKEFEQKI